MDNKDRRAFILKEIQTILGSITNLKHTLLGIKEYFIRTQLSEFESYPYTLTENEAKTKMRIGHRLLNSRGNSIIIQYFLPHKDDEFNMKNLQRRIKEKGGDVYSITGNLSPEGSLITVNVTIKSKKPIYGRETIIGIDALPDVFDTETRKEEFLNSINIEVQSGGRRRKHTKKARKSRRGRSRKHRS
jgi:hypothetical protein